MVGPKPPAVPGQVIADLQRPQRGSTEECGEAGVWRYSPWRKPALSPVNNQERARRLVFLTRSKEVELVGMVLQGEPGTS
jgi:hypothetical protein